MRASAKILAAALLALALSGCLETTSNSSSAIDPSFACPSGNCEGLSSAHNIGGNGMGF